RHQRAAAGIAQQHDLFYAMLAQPFHPDADIGDGMLQMEEVLGAAIARIPSQEAEAAPREIGCDIVLGEVDIVVRCDQRGLWALPLRRPIESLAGMSASTRARHVGRGK